MNKRISAHYLCGHVYTAKVQADTSSAAIAVMESVCAQQDCAECRQRSQPRLLTVYDAIGERGY